MWQRTQIELEKIMADYKHGSMDTKEQEKTFAGFMRMVSWGGVAIVVILIVLALSNA
jgi:Bacterial aa3 type cytochrome c oxidase subunit IV